MVFKMPDEQHAKGVMAVTLNERRWLTETLTCPELLQGFSVNAKDIFAWPSVPQQEAKE
jgi:hypothetical protein